jgi:hypothetical protein
VVVTEDSPSVGGEGRSDLLVAWGWPTSRALASSLPGRFRPRGGLRMSENRPRECRWGVELRDRVDVRRAYAFLLSVRAVSRELRISESAVRAAIAPGARTRYVRRASETTIARASDPQIRAMLERYPRISIDAAMRELGWVRSRSALARRLRELRPEYADRPAVPGVGTGPLRGGVGRGGNGR